MQTNEGVQINQNLYIPTISPINIDSHRHMQSLAKLTLNEKAELKKLNAQMWVTSQTISNMSFETCVMSNMGKNPMMKMLQEANKALLKLQSMPVKLKFPYFGNPHKLQVVGCADTTYASLGDGSSQGTYVIFLQGDNRKIASISWQSKKLDRATKSPLASEALALGEAADAGFLISFLVSSPLLY